MCCPVPVSNEIQNTYKRVIDLRFPANAQSPTRVIYGQNTSHQIIIKIPFHCSSYMRLYGWRGFGKNEVKGTVIAEIGKTVSLALGKACETV